MPAYAMAGLLYVNVDPERARLTLRSAFDAGDPADHPFTRNYLSALRVLVPIAEGVTAQQFIDRDAVGLTLAEVLQEAGEISEAIEVVEHLEPSFVAAVSFAELYSLAERHKDVIETAGAEINPLRLDFSTQEEDFQACRRQNLRSRSVEGRGRRQLRRCILEPTS